MAFVNPFRDINITAAPTHYLFRSPSAPNAAALVVDRPSGDLKMVESPMLGGKRVTSIAGILGMIQLRLDKYIIIITKAKLTGRIRGHSVYKVEATEFLPMQERALHDPDEDTYLSLLRTHLRTAPMYFSYSFDLTNTFQRQLVANHSLPLWQRADDRFFWNRYIQSDLIDLRSTNTHVDPYILPVFFGFLKIATTVLKNTPLTFVLITRKSRHRVGTRYLTRGVDETGNVANFNETEQVVIVGTEKVQILSYVQTRGSVPVFWAETNNLSYIPPLQIRGVDTAVAASRAHFDQQIKLYGDNYLVNLVNQSGREEKVKTAYEKIVKLLRFREIEPTKKEQRMDRLHYIYFDFHHECRGLKWHRALLLLDKIGDGLLQQKYFHSVESGTTSNVQCYQQSVVRTNCMDCLDRTNVVQSMLAKWTLNRQMIDIGVLAPGESIESYLNFEFTFRNAWADNADVVSRAYSGTGALKTDFTRTGKRTTAGALVDLSNSITRYFRNNFTDGTRQDAYDLFLGNYLPSNNYISSHLFVDRRPIVVQSIPYIFYAAIFLEFALLVLPRQGDGTSGQISMRLFALFWLVVAVWAVLFVKEYGMFYVCWPKLNVPAFAVEGYNETLNRAKKDKVVGKWLASTTTSVGGRERGASMGGANMRLIHLEEGKKRIE
ncbi:SacI homology domain-containing protein [Trichophaea hybrida]|nr:SacI homology domain-containing protein [Trichophaea hybrida]